MMISLDWDYHRLAHAADRTIADLAAPRPRAATLYARLLADPQTLALWDMTGYMAVEKLGYNDHGQMHAQVVAGNALRLLDLLGKANVEPVAWTAPIVLRRNTIGVSLRACVVPEAGEAEQVLHCLVLREGRFQPETPPVPVDTTWPVDPVCLGFDREVNASS